MAEAPNEPEALTKVMQLRPWSCGVTLTLKVVSTKIVAPKSRAGGPRSQMPVAECLVGDETAMVVFRARNKQVDLMQEGSTITVRNAKINLFKASMRLVVEQNGLIEVADQPADFIVNEDNNLSLIEFDRIDVAV